MGIEPTSSAWKAEVLPLNYTRAFRRLLARLNGPVNSLVEGGGFEPPKAEPSDLQSDPFGRSGTPPNVSRALCGRNPRPVNGFLAYFRDSSTCFLTLATDLVES